MRALATTDDILLARERVWIALSDLYLDTDTDPFVEPCARVMAASPFSRQELRRIALDEVHPALASNLLPIAGVWDGFDTVWLCTQLRQPGHGWWAPFNPMRYYLRREFRARWQQLDAIIAAIRASESRS